MEDDGTCKLTLQSTETGRAAEGVGFKDMV
jgi:hypothetical protein